ncbi:TM2 domain-containing protein [Chloroflexi bacterium TSY]|nr:TM2 domain-containing protein [Chloroflexi bacterium TSY]
MAAQIRLSHVQSEIRLLERSAQSRTTHRQLAELYQQETVLNQQIISLQATLDPELQRDGGIFGTVLDDTSTTTPIWSVGCGWTVAAFVLASLIINIIPSAERFSGIIAIGIAVAVYVYFQKQVRDSLSTGKTANRSSIYSNTISNIGNPRLSRVNPSSKAITLLLCVFGLFGLAGLHRLYTGHVVIGIIQLLTMGGLMIWTLIDLVLILTGNFRDSEGRMLL